MHDTLELAVLKKAWKIRWKKLISAESSSFALISHDSWHVTIRTTEHGLVR